jgi:hypothetical protein
VGKVAANMAATTNRLNRGRISFFIVLLHVE